MPQVILNYFLGYGFLTEFRNCLTKHVWQWSQELLSNSCSVLNEHKTNQCNRSRIAYKSTKNKSRESDFHTLFFSRRVSEAEALGGPETPHGFQQPLIVSLAPHQNGSKPSGYNHTTWFLVDFWAFFPWVYPAGLHSINFPGTFWHMAEPL